MGLSDGIAWEKDNGRTEYVLTAIFDNGDEESIGCNFTEKWKCELFKQSFEQGDWNRLDEFMPDSDYREVKKLVIRTERIM